MIDRVVCGTKNTNDERAASFSVEKVQAVAEGGAHFVGDQRILVPISIKVSIAIRYQLRSMDIHDASQSTSLQLQSEFAP